MRAKGLCIAGIAALVGLAYGCGSGHAIFNVDVYSFLQGTGKDTVPYLVPPGPAVSASSTPQKVHLPGAAGSLVDSVVILGTAKVENQSDTGTVAFQLFLAADSAGTYTAAPAFSVSPAVVKGVDTVVVTISGSVSPSADSLFTRDSLWVRLSAVGTDSGLITPLAGKLVLTSLLLRVVMNLKLL
jgi:hypothetical protein